MNGYIPSQPYNQDTYYGVYNPVISTNGQRVLPEQQEKKRAQDKISADIASLEYMSIANKRNEKFSGNLISIINANQEKDGDTGLNKIKNALLGGQKVLDLSEKIKFVDEKGQAQEYSVEDLATDNKFATLSDVAQQNFLKSFSDPDRGKSDARLKFDKTKKWFLAGFGVVGIGAGLTGTLLAINASLGVAGFLAAATASSMGIALAVIGAIGLVIGIAFFANKIASYVKNSKISKENANVRKKINDLSTSVHKDKEEVQSKLEELKKSIPKENLENMNAKNAAADAAKNLDKKKENPETKIKQNKFVDNHAQIGSYIKKEENNQKDNQGLAPAK
jgi:hypothetical protein